MLCPLPLSGGHRVISASGDKTLRVWDLERGVCERVLEGHSGVSESLSSDHF
jgi:WD40 repeat protein